MTIRSSSAPDCFLCKKEGMLLHEALRDRLFGAPGVWNLRRCQNPRCGLLWLDPMPLPEDIHKAYETFTTHAEPPQAASLKRSILISIKNGYLQHRYGYRQGVGSRFLRFLFPLALMHPGGRAEMDAVSYFLPAPRPSERLLEIGCGNGQSLQRLRELGWDVEGVEVDPVAVELARSKGIRVSHGKLADAGFPDEHFDAVLMHHVIEHVHDPEPFLRECRRIIKPGGKLVMVTPNADSLGHRRHGRNWYPLDPPRHLYVYTVQSMEALLAKAGFEASACSTNARGARTYQCLSTCLKDTDHADPHYTGSKLEKIRGIVFQLLERMLLVFSPRLGEELLAVAFKEKK
jgi:SAM-dependent methyltransferase